MSNGRAQKVSKVSPVVSVGGNFITSKCALWFLWAVLGTAVISVALPYVVLVTVDMEIWKRYLVSIVAFLPMIWFFGYWWKVTMGGYWGWLIAAAMVLWLPAYMIAINIVFLIQRDKLPQIKSPKQMHWILDLVLSIIYILLVTWIVLPFVMGILSVILMMIYAAASGAGSVPSV